MDAHRVGACPCVAGRVAARDIVTAPRAKRLLAPAVHEPRALGTAGDAVTVRRSRERRQDMSDERQVRGRSSRVVRVRKGHVRRRATPTG